MNNICSPKTTTCVSASWILDIHFPELKLELHSATAYRTLVFISEDAHIVTVVVIVIDLVILIIVVIVLVGCFKGRGGTKRRITQNTLQLQSDSLANAFI